MAIIKEKFDGLRMNFTADKREYFATYLVKGVVSSSAFPPYFRWDCKGLIDPFARLTGLGASRQMNADWFEVEANYSTLPVDNTQRSADKDQPQNPIARPIIRRWTTGYMEFYPPKDLDGKPFCVSTGEPIRGGVPVKIPYLVKHYTRNEAYFPESTALSMIWAIDSSKTILCAKFEGSEEFEDKQTGIKFVQVNYEFWCLGNGNNWEEKRLDAGSYWKENGKPKYLEDKDGTKAYADGGILLDGNGGKLADGANPHWNTFGVYPITSFSSLGLPGI